MRRVCLLSYLAAIILAASLSVQAAEWSAKPEISLRTGYNDNIRLTNAPHDSVWETDLTPAVKFGVAKEHQGLFGDARVAIRRFSGGSGFNSSSVLDREDYFLKTDAYHSTLRDVFRANLDYSETSTLDTELDEFGNVVPQTATLRRVAVGPSWERALNERTRLSVSYRFTTVDYPDDPGTSDLVAYDYDVLSSSLVRQFTARTQGTLSASYNRYRPDTLVSADSDTISLQAGISRSLSETVVASFLAGQRQTTTDTQVLTGFCIGADPGASFPDCAGGIPIPTGSMPDQIKSTGSVYSASITKNLESGFLSIAISRASNPSSQGDLLDTTRLILSSEHRFSETLRATLNAEYNERETIVNRIGRELNQGKRKLLRIRPRISWHWRREWEIAGLYEYAENKNIDSAKAKRNAVYLTLSYLPTKMSVSR